MLSYLVLLLLSSGCCQQGPYLTAVGSVRLRLLTSLACGLRPDAVLLVTCVTTLPLLVLVPILVCGCCPYLWLLHHRPAFDAKLSVPFMRYLQQKQADKRCLMNPGGPAIPCSSPIQVDRRHLHAATVLVTMKTTFNADSCNGCVAAGGSQQ